MAELRQRQLAFLGWTVHSVHLRCLYTAVLDCNLRSFVAQIASACCPQAAEAVSFQQQQQHQQEQQEQQEGTAGNESKVNRPVAALLGEAILEDLPCLQRGKAEIYELNDDTSVASGSSISNSLRHRQQQQQQQQERNLDAPIMMSEQFSPCNDLQLETSKEVELHLLSPEPPFGLAEKHSTQLQQQQELQQQQQHRQKQQQHQQHDEAGDSAAIVDVLKKAVSAAGS
ncbi:hypothetical protein ACSSS7_008051 [Eimeria intestinalis]